MKPSKPIRKGILFLLPIFLFFGCKNQEVHEPQTHIVEIIEMKFQPEELQVYRGDTVVWVNKDIVAHDVTEVDKAWASHPLANGASWKKEITKNEAYYCSIHLIMKGKVTIIE